MPTLDTYTAITKLEAAGASEPEARAIVALIEEATQVSTSELVTRDHLDTALAQLESRLMRVALAQTGLFAGLVAGIFALFEYA